MAAQSTRENHYVPIWYQRGFLKPGASKLHRLDMNPDPIHLPGGQIKTRDAVHYWSPKRCFLERDLYTTFFGSHVNDEIERYLFGSIDDRGSKAIRAFISGDFTAVHESFSDFFEFLDAQKLRTPKGLDWIAARYSGLNQLELMRQMQGLRLMHCTMWMEAVREIVSAEDSDVKFLVSDHPVTTYNSVCNPSAPDCKYPNDPPIDLIGTQTVFPLDANTCLILTNLEYAQDPQGRRPMDRRTNARYHGGGLVRTDAFIRGRKLGRNEVLLVNQLLKSRARRFVAAGEEEWLYPERFVSSSWRDIGQVLLPQEGLFHFGGELFVGNDDGITHYQDQFGRTSKAHEYLRRRKVAVDLGPNDACGCGSGKKFKQCCEDLPDDHRPSWKVFGLRERNLMFARRVQRILGLDAGKTWDDIRRDLTDDQVVQIHEAFGSLWPRDTDLAELLPRPNSRVFRVTYLGAPNVRTIHTTVLGWLAYFDEIVLANPFINPVGVKPEFNPTKSPGQFKVLTLRNVFLLLLLEPFIDRGLIHLVPSPGDFNADFGRTMMKMAEERTEGWEMDPEDASDARKLWNIELQRDLARLPDDSLRRQLEQAGREDPPKDIDKLVAYLKAELAADPFALLQPIEFGEGKGHLHIVKGFALEAALYLASLTGSAVYTDLKVHWQHLHQHTSAGSSGEDPSASLEAWRDIELTIERDPNEILRIRAAGRLGEARAALRKIMGAVQGTRDSSTESLVSNQLRIVSKAASKLKSLEKSGTWTLGKIAISAPVNGFERNDIRRLLLTYGRAGAIPHVQLAMRVQAPLLRT